MQVQAAIRLPRDVAPWMESVRLAFADTLPPAVSFGWLAGRVRPVSVAWFTKVEPVRTSGRTCTVKVAVLLAGHAVFGSLEV